MDPKEKRDRSDNPRNARIVIYGLCVVCAILFGLDFVIHRHAEFAVDGWYGFYGIYGVGAGVFLVFAAKAMWKFVRRDEDYYDDK